MIRNTLIWCQEVFYVSTCIDNHFSHISKDFQLYLMFYSHVSSLRHMLYMTGNNLEHLLIRLKIIWPSSDFKILKRSVKMEYLE